jgi:hypothetical protein
MFADVRNYPINTAFCKNSVSACPLTYTVIYLTDI